MAKKDPASKRRPTTSQDYLARLPQFEPRPTPFGRHGILPLPLGDLIGKNQEPRENRIDDVLSKFMAPYIRDATKLQPFLNDAKRAIGGYVGARETEYDRRKAKTLLTETLTDLVTARRKLQDIAGWPELSNYLKRVYRDAPVWPENKNAAPTERPEPSSARKQAEQARQRTAALDRSYSDFAPDQIAWRLSQLETVVSLADERVTFGLVTHNGTKLLKILQINWRPRGTLPPKGTRRVQDHVSKNPHRSLGCWRRLIKNF